MDLALFIAKRITFKSERTFSKLIVQIAILGITLGLAVMILSIGIVKGFKSEIREKIRGFAGDIRIAKLDLNMSYETSPFVIDPFTVEQIKSYPDISYLQPFATKPGIIKTHDEVESVIMKGVDKTYHADYFKHVLVAGRTINFSDSVQSQKEIMISKFTADQLRLKLGDDLLMYFVQEPLRKRKFTIVGIFDLGFEEIDKVYVIGDIALIRRLNNWQDKQVGGYEIGIKDFDRLDVVANQVYDRLDLNIKSYSVKESFPVIFQWLSMLDVNTQVILVLMLAVAIINMISALLIMILERTNMIGILKAMGSSNWEVRKIFLYNASYLIGIGLLFGNILGIGTGFLQQKTHLLKLDQASYYISFIPIEFHLTDILLLNVGTLLICIFVLLIPSLLITKISPIQAITFK